MLEIDALAVDLLIRKVWCKEILDFVELKYYVVEGTEDYSKVDKIVEHLQLFAYVFVTPQLFEAVLKLFQNFVNDSISDADLILWTQLLGYIEQLAEILGCSLRLQLIDDMPILLDHNFYLLIIIVHVFLNLFLDQGINGRFLESVKVFCGKSILVWLYQIIIAGRVQSCLSHEYDVKQKFIPGLQVYRLIDVLQLVDQKPVNVDIVVIDAVWFEKLLIWAF